jgi:FdhE protein
MTFDPRQPATAAQIKQAAETIQKIRPGYSPMIAFYSQIFAAQAEALPQITPDPIVINPDLLALKMENEMPLISPIQFIVDMTAAEALITTIADLAVTHAPKLAGPADTLSTALDQGRLNLDTLFTCLLDSRDITELSHALEMTPESLGFFGYNAMFPSIQACAAQLATYLPQDHDHNKGYCPICGTAPDLAFLDDKGNRQVFCALCSHTWRVKRLGCLFCDVIEKDGHSYFFSEDEKEYRVTYCDACKNYLKTIDTREMGRRFIPRLEQVTTLHLDLQAGEQGYTRAGDAPA